MQMSERGLAALIADEGEVLRAYRDVAGVWTIGVGLTAASGVVKPMAGMTITRDQSRELLGQALTRNYAPYVARRLGEVPQHVFDAALSFHFNTGAIGRASWVAKYQQSDMAGAKAAFLAWSQAGGRVVAGLANRRAREWRLLSAGEYPQHARAALRTSLRSGDSGEAVAGLQRDLVALGFLALADVDGRFGAKTDAAVRKLQQAHPQLTIDGIAGPATRATIRRLRDARIAAGAAVALPPVVGAAATAMSWKIAAAILAVSLVGAGLLVWRYRDELRAHWRNIRRAR
jgi:lysozyme